MDNNEFIEMDLQLGEALSEIKKLQAAVDERDRRIEELQELFQHIIRTAQRSYSPSSIRDGGFPAASGKEVSKEAF
jgi:peptidoglycan hydrolase CwlO-like protein